MKIEFPRCGGEPDEVHRAIAIDEIIRRRRSIRKFRPDEVPEEALLEVLDLARHAPSSMGGQPWRFIVVRDRGTKERLAAIKEAHTPPEKLDYSAGFLSRAPAVVVVCVERDESWSREIENGALAAAFLILAAQDRGLGSVYLTAYRDRDPELAREIREALGVAEGLRAIAIVPLGFPAEAPRPKPLPPLEEIVVR